MKNRDKWVQKRFFKNDMGHFIGHHMQRLVGPVYEEAIKKYTVGYLADLGCGDVPYYHFYKDLIIDNICIDWRNSTLDISYCDIETDLNMTLPLDNNLFDTVLATDVLEHLSMPHVFFKEISRILKPDGYLILGVPFLYWIHDDNFDYHRYTHQMLREYCNQNSMEVIELNTYGGLPEVIFDLVHKGYAFYNFRGTRLFYYFWEGFGKFMSKMKFVKKMSINSRHVFPMGYLLVARKM